MWLLFKAVSSVIFITKSGMASAQSSPGVSFAEHNSKNSSPDEANLNQNEQRTKFLTMKYGQQEIKLIQKRLKIEFWMDAQLKKLYQVDVSCSGSYYYLLDG